MIHVDSIKIQDGVILQCTIKGDHDVVEIVEAIQAKAGTAIRKMRQDTIDDFRRTHPELKYDLFLDRGLTFEAWLKANQQVDKRSAELAELRRNNQLAQMETIREWGRNQEKVYIPIDDSMTLLDWVQRNRARAEFLRQSGLGSARRWARMRETCWGGQGSWWTYMVTPEEGRIDLGPYKTIHDAYKMRCVALLWEGVE